MLHDAMLKLTRRDALIGLGATAALAASSGSALAKDDDKPGVKPLPSGKHEIVPLPFDASKLSGISEKLIRSHWENNYSGAVKNLNKVEDQLATVTKDTPGFVVSGLKEKELTYANSAALHEHYFGNLGGNGKASGAISSALAEQFGSLGRFEELFRATGMSLSGGSGWTILDLDFHTGDLRIFWAGNHTQSRAFAAPLLVLDMYEHAYAMDYGAAAGKYVDAFVANVNWDEVEKRYERATKALQALRS